MSGRARARDAAAVTRPRWLVLAIVSGLAALVGAAALAIVPYLFEPAALEREMAAQIKATTGLVLQPRAPARFGLFPQPYVSMAGLRLADSSGTLMIDAEAFSGEVRLFALMAGRLELASASLIRPQLRINLDAGPLTADSTIGRALHGGANLPKGRDQRLGVVNLSEGRAIIASQGAGDTTISHINVTLDWRNLDAAAALTGTVEFQSETADVAVWMGLPSSLMMGDHSPFALRIQSPALTLSANGELENSPALRFRGHLSASAPSLAAVLKMAGRKPPLPAPFANVVIASDATIDANAIDLQNLNLQMDGNSFEGTLAYQGADGKPALSGTLATDQLSLLPFIGSLPRWYDASRHWSDTKLKLDPKDRLLLDLRISASHLSLPPVTIEDAALAVISRDGRTEVALVGGKAYGGILKGRASAALTDAGLNLRATATLSGADASAMSWDIFGRQRINGTLTASTNLETSGDSILGLVNGLNGWSKLRIDEGELSDIDIGHGLREIGRKRPDTVLAALRNGRTPFSSLALGFNITGGEAAAGEGLLQGPDATLTLTGTAALGTRQLDLQAIATAPAGADPAIPPPRLSFVITGPFDQPEVTPVLGALAEP